MHTRLHSHSHMHTHRGKRYEENCKTSAVYMDDLLPGVIIEGVLGVNLTDCRGFKSQMDNRLTADSKEIRNMVYILYYIYTGRVLYKVVGQPWVPPPI